MVFGANHVRTKTNSSASVLHTAGSSVIFPGIPKHVGPLWEWYGGPTYGKGVPFVGDPHGISVEMLILWMETQLESAPAGPADELW